MSKIAGTTVTLYSETLAGTDSDGNDVYEEEAVSVENVLVGEPTTDDAKEATDLYGKKIEYILGIPKDDQNDWQDKKVEIFGDYYQTFGFAMRGIESNIPGDWNAKVRVARYE